MVPRALSSTFTRLWRAPGPSPITSANLNPVSIACKSQHFHTPNRFNPTGKQHHSTLALPQQQQQQQQDKISPAPAFSPVEPATITSLSITLERALKERRTDDAVWAIDSLRSRGTFPSREHLGVLVSQLAYKQTPFSLSQADRLVQEIVTAGRNDLLDHNSLSILALAYAGVGMSNFSRSTLRLMFQTGLYPPVRVWSGVVAKIAEKLTDAPAALELFKEVCQLTSSLAEPAHRANRAASRAVEELDPVARIIKLMDVALQPPRKRENEELLLQMRPDIVAFNSALSICLALGDAQGAEEVFETMCGFGISPDSSSFEFLIKAYGRAGRFDMFRRLPQKMADANVKPSASTLKALVDSYVDSGNVEEAEQLLERTTGSGSGSSMWHLVKFNGDLYNSLLRYYVSQGRNDDAARLIRGLPPEDAGLGLSQAKVLWSMVSSGLLAEANSILQHALHHRIELHFSTYTTMMQGLCSNNQLDKAASFIILMKKAGIKPDCSIYSPLILGLIRCRDRLLAFNTFLEMVNSRIPPDEATYVALLKALTVEERASKMVSVLESVLEFPGVRVGLFSWNLVIEYCSKRRLVGDAQRLLAKMIPAGVQPDSFTYWYVVKGLITRSRLVEVVGLWPQIQNAIRTDRADRITLHKELVESLMYAFVKGAFFSQALELLAYARGEGIPLDKEAFKDLFLRYHSHRFTSKHKSPLRVFKRQHLLEEMEEFKRWLNLGAVKTPARYAKILKFGPVADTDEGPFY